MFSGFGINKISQISRTFLRILAECEMTVLCNSVTIASILKSANLFFSFFGVAPNAPKIILFLFLVCVTKKFLYFSTSNCQDQTMVLRLSY